MFNRLFYSPFFSRLIPFLALILCLPAVFTGFMGDDYFFYGLFSGYQGIKPIDDASLFNLFSFANGDPERLAQMQQLGLMPWWTVAEFKTMFFRPLAELSHFCDFSLWPESSLMMHMHNLLWFFAVLWVLRGLYQNWFSAPYGFATLALLIFAFDGSHALTISWIANRNALIAAFFALLALTFFIRWREQGQIKYAGLAILFYFLGLASAEIALSISAYFFAYAICLERKGLWVGLKSLLPFAVLSVLWLWLYKHLGFGASGVPSFYLDPMADPLLFLQQLMQRLPIMLMSQWGVMPAEMSQGKEFSDLAIWHSRLGLALLLIIWLPLVIKDRLLRFFLIAACVSVLPVCSALPQDRNLFFVGFAGSAAVARYCQIVWQYRSEWPVLKRSLHQFMVIVLLLVHVLLAALLLPVISYAPSVFNGISMQAAKETPDLEGKHVFFLNVPSAVSWYFTPIRYYLKLDMPVSTQVLSMTQEGGRWEVVDNHRLRLHLPEGLTAGEGKLVRDIRTKPLKPGQIFSLNQVTIQLTQFRDQDATELLLDFKQPLANDNYVFGIWEDGKVRYLNGAEL